MCLCVPFWLKQKFALQFPGFVPSCVCPRLSLRFSRFYSAGVAESQKDLESLTGEVSEWRSKFSLQVNLEGRKMTSFHVFILQGAQEPLVRLAPTKTLTIGCVNVPAGTPWAPSCAAWVPTQTSIF